MSRARYIALRAYERMVSVNEWEKELGKKEALSFDRASVRSRSER
jgi:hypothetical protein